MDHRLRQCRDPSRMQAAHRPHREPHHGRASIMQESERPNREVDTPYLCCPALIFLRYTVPAHQDPPKGFTLSRRLAQCQGLLQVCLNGANQRTLRTVTKPQHCQTYTSLRYQPALHQVQSNQQWMCLSHGPRPGEPMPCWNGANRRDGPTSWQLSATDQPCPHHTGPAAPGGDDASLRSQALSKVQEQMTHCPRMTHRSGKHQVRESGCQEQHLHMQSLSARVAPSYKALYDRFALCHLGSASARMPTFWPYVTPWRVRPTRHLGAVLGPISVSHDPAGSMPCREIAKQMQLRPQNQSLLHIADVHHITGSRALFSADPQHNPKYLEVARRLRTSSWTCLPLLTTRLLSLLSSEVRLPSLSRYSGIQCWSAPHWSPEIDCSVQSPPCFSCQHCSRATHSACNALAKNATQPAAKSHLASCTSSHGPHRGAVARGAADDGTGQPIVEVEVEMEAASSNSGGGSGDGCSQLQL